MNKEVRPKYTLRKLSVGLASVMIGSTILLTSQQVHAADNTSADAATSNKVTDQKQDSSNNASDNQVPTADTNTDQTTNSLNESSKEAFNSSTDNKDVTVENDATDTVKKQVQTQSQTQTADPFTPAKPTDNSTAKSEDTAIVNQKVNDQPVKAQKDASFEAYITAKDKTTGEEYTTSYLGDPNAESTINLDLIDPNSLEYHVIYHTGDQAFRPNFYIGTANGYGANDNLFVDESRMNDQNKLVQVQSGRSHNVIFRVQGTGDYISYDQWLKVKDTAKYQGKGLTAWKISDFDMNANDTATVTIPIKFKSVKTEDIGVIDQANYWTPEGVSPLQTPVAVVDNALLEKQKMFTPDQPTDVAEVDGKKPAIYNDGISTNPAMSVNNMKAYVYFTGKDLAGNTFVSNYLSPDSKPVDIDLANLDPKTLELHFIYQNDSNNVIYNNFRLTSPEAVAGSTGTLTIDTSRLNDQNSKYSVKSGGDYGLRYKVAGMGETYVTYDQWKAGKDTTYKGKNLILAWSGWGVSRLAPGDTVAAVIPVTLAPGQNQKLGLVDWQGHYINLEGKVNVNFDKDKVLDFAKPSQGSTFDEDNKIPVFYNFGTDGQAHTDPHTTWYPTEDGSVAYYLTFKDKSGKEYVTTYSEAGLRLMFDSDMIDRQSIQFVGYYENGNKAANPELHFAPGVDFKINQGQVSAVDSDGNKVDVSFSTNGGKELATLTGQVGANKAVKFTVPLTYTGNGYTYASSFEYGFDNQNENMTVIISPKDYDLSKRTVVFLPSTKVDGYQTGLYVPELDQALKDAGLKASDVFLVSNFPMPDRGLFTKDALPQGPNPTIVYKASQEFYLLDKIEDVITKHGYTVEFRTNNGQRVPMMFYRFYGPVDVHINNPGSNTPAMFMVLMANTDLDNPSGSDINIYNPGDVIKKYFNTVPAILINSDKVYDQTSTQTFWDPRNVGKDTGTTDAEKEKDPYLLRGYYRADFDSSQELPSFSELEKNYSLDSHAAATDPNYLHVDITWQSSPDSKDVEKLDSDKIDLSRAGYYTITYWHEYGDSKTKVSNVGHVTVLPSRKATVVVHDTTDNQDLKSFETDGHVGDSVSFDDLANYLSDLESQNYQIDDNPLANNDAKFTWDEAPLAYVIKVSHKQETVSRSKDVTRTINYQTSTGQLLDSRKDTLTFTQTGTKDLVTGKTNWDDSAISQTFSAVTVPERAGYTVSPKLVPAKTISVDSSNWDANLDYVETVVYTPNQANPDNPTIPTDPDDQTTNPDNPADDTTTDTEDITVNPNDGQDQNGDQSNGNNDQKENQEVAHLTINDHGKGGNSQGQQAELSNVVEKQKLPQTGEKKTSGVLGTILAWLGLSLLAGMLYAPKKKR